MGAIRELLRERTQCELAAEVGVTQPVISRWASGQGRPAPHHRARLAVLYGIPERDWLTAEELALIEAA